MYAETSSEDPVSSPQTVMTNTSANPMWCEAGNREMSATPAGSLFELVDEECEENFGLVGHTSATRVQVAETGERYPHPGYDVPNDWDVVLRDAPEARSARSAETTAFITCSLPSLTLLNVVSLPPTDTGVMAAATTTFPMSDKYDQENVTGGAKCAKGQIRSQARRGKPNAGKDRKDRKDRKAQRKSKEPTPRKGRGRHPSTACAKSETKQQMQVECDLHQCEECGKKFLKREYLRKHSQSIHQNKKLKCKFCEGEFGEKTDLNRHLKTIHNRNAKGQELDEGAKTRCDYPGCKFETYRVADKLRDHAKTHKGLPLLTCSRTRGNVNPKPCKFVCFTKKSMRLHEERKSAGHTTTPPRRLRGSGTPDE